MKIIDPVCGMTIEETKVAVTFSHKGTIYYFCSEKCKEEFAKDPETVLVMKAEREKDAEKERLESLEKMMDQVAHEMRNPLTSIGGFTRRMYEKLPEGDPNRKYLEVVIDDVSRLESMIRQLIELKAMGMTHKEPCNVNDVIGEAIKSFKEELRDMNLEVRTELMDNPPTISVDRYKLMTALANLLKNSAEAMEKTPGVLTISSCLSKEHIEIAVSDTGKGIPQDKIKYIFDPFFTSKIYGPGLGLTFARRIIQEHKGTISVESELGKGTTFTVRLPLIRGRALFNDK